MKYSATHSMGQESGKKSTATLSRTSSPNFVGKLSQRSPTPTLNSNYIKMNYGKSARIPNDAPITASPRRAHHLCTRFYAAARE